MAKNVRITVIKKFSPQDVFGEELKNCKGNLRKACTAFEIGQKFIVKGGERPEKFYPWAWRDLYKDIAVLRFGGNFDHCDEGSIYTSCTDGMRPVCFLLERIND